MAKKKDKDMLTERKREIYEKYSGILEFWRENPSIACEQLLGIRLYDSQRYLLEQMFISSKICITSCRAFGKTFLAMVYIALRFLLFENVDIYIVSKSGSQAQEAFLKLEKMARKQLGSCPDLLDILMGEVKSSGHSDGFVHDKISFRVENYIGNVVHTVNSIPDNARSRRATDLLLDESSYIAEEMVESVKPFLVTDSSSKVSVNRKINHKAQRKIKPNTIIYASSAGSIDSLHYRVYRDFAKQMIAGDDDYLVFDADYTLPTHPFLDGEPAPPQLTEDKIDADMRVNPEKAKREYMNVFSSDSGENQAVRRAQITRNETFLFPTMYNNTGDRKFAVAIDPARSVDNSIFSAMEIKYNEEIGYYGELCNCIHFADLGKKKKTPMRTPEQIKLAREYISDYNGEGNPDYQNIEALLIDSGAGGAGKSAWADNLLEDWIDKKGNSRKGFIDWNDPEYEQERKDFPNASQILNLVSPKKWKTIMGNELCELMELDLIKFPSEYKGRSFIPYTEEVEGTDELIVKERILSTEEQISLVNIDIMKSETVSIHKFLDSNGVVNRYALKKEVENRMHDDRFYTLLMLAHYLYELRREDQLGKSRKPRKKQDTSKLLDSFKKPTIRKR